MKKLILLASITPMLVGCGITQPTDNNLRAQQAVMESIAYCYKSQADVERLRSLSLASVPKEQQALVVIMSQQQEFTKQIVAIATGNSYNPCASTNLFDAQIAEVKARNNTATQITNGALSMVPWIVGGFTLTAIADNSSGGSLNAGGDITYQSDGSNNQRQSFKSNNTSTGDSNNHSDDPAMSPITMGDNSSNDENDIPTVEAPIEE